MQRFKKFIYYLFMYTWRKLQGRHSFGMFRTCLERAGKSSCLDIRAKERGSVLQLFRNATDKFAVLFRLALTHVPSLKCKPVVHGSKRFSRSLPTFPIANPLCSDSLASMPRLKSAITDKFRDGTAIDRPKFAEKTDTAKFAEVPEFHGITDIHTFNSFHSFYSFLRKTFFHTRYVLVTGKDTKKVSMPVYNLSIANDESYVIPLGIVHNCRCTVVQVRKDKYPVSDEQEAMNLGSQATAGKYQEMFMFNPGKRMTTFPAYNGYTLRKCNRCEVRPDKMKLAADIPDNEVCRACRLLQESRLAGIHSATEGIRSIIRRLENGYPKGDAVRIGRLADDVKEFVRKKGIEPSTDEIYMTDKQIHHALRSVKQKAGKAVTAEQLAALPSLMDDSEVYWDEKAGNIQFITRQDGKIQKFVVSLNYAAKIQGEKKTVNAFITAGTIEERNLGMKNLVKIK